MFVYLKINTSRFGSLSKKNELHIVGETKKKNFKMLSRSQNRKKMCQINLQTASLEKIGYFETLTKVVEYKKFISIVRMMEIFW